MDPQTVAESAAVSTSVAKFISIPAGPFYTGVVSIIGAGLMFWVSTREALATQKAEINNVKQMVPKVDQIQADVNFIKGFIEKRERAERNQQP